MNFIDIQAQYKRLKAEIDEAIAGVLTHGQFIMGPEVAEFEKEMASFIGVKHCISCANGTDALQLLYMAYGIGAGDAVFCPDITIIATIEPACMLGATPVFCDIETDTYNMCPISLEKQIKSVISEGKLVPKAVVPIDFLGNPANYQALEQVCQKYGLILIEDAAQSTGAHYHGKLCGSLGHSAATSFFPAKPLGCYGDGGAVFTNDDNIADICKSIRIHGQGPLGKYHNVRVGVNSRLDTLQAAILLPKLKALKSFEIDARQTVASIYNKAFSHCFVTPYVAENTQSIYAQYSLLAAGEHQRGDVLDRLNKADIPSMVYYPAPLHTLEVFQHVQHYGECFLNSIDYCRRTFSLPMHPYLTEDDQRQVIDCVLK